MRYYFAPMEGITSYLYRRIHHEMFPGIDKYFTPFIAAGKNKKLKSREKNDILPEYNEGIYVVPQILTNQADDFIQLARLLSDYGYEEINLNLGCPSGTVVAKGRGAGFLAKTEELSRFFEQVFSQLDMKISVKTRIGMDSPAEFDELLKVFNQYPIYELIVHPRTRQDMYRNNPNHDVFAQAVRESKNPLCYNGDIFTEEDAKAFSLKFPDTHTVMLGRGLLINPALVEQLKGTGKLEQEALKGFHDQIYIEYQSILSGDRNILFKMKELWNYFICVFPESDRYMKKIRKAQNCVDYEMTVKTLFQDRRIEW